MRLRAPDQGFRRWPGFDSRERSYLRIARAPGYELWLIRWPPDTGARAHDHGGAAGAVAVLEGELVERVYRTEAHAGDPRTERWTAQRSQSFASDHLHAVWNESLRDAWSLHVYAPRLASMRFYAARTNGALAATQAETESSWS